LCHIIVELNQTRQKSSDLSSVVILSKQHMGVRITMIGKPSLWWPKPHFQS